MSKKILYAAPLLFVTVLLAGCQKFTVLFPSGHIAIQQRNMLVASVILMLFVVIPVFVATIFFMFRYHRSNKKATYAPDWEHSIKLELLVWGGPLIIVLILGAMTWVGTHQLDPYSELTHIDHNTPVVPRMEPLRINAIALQWKWLFLYPEYDIATVGALAAPVDVPLNFRITSTDVMNSFFIPAMAGQIYAMPRMRTKLNAVINEPGVYKGISANFSGAGYPYMDFKFKAMKKQQFHQWVNKIQKGNGALTKTAFQELAVPDVVKKVKRYSDYKDGLFRAVVLGCFGGSAMCREVMPKMCVPDQPKFREPAEAEITTASARQIADE